MCTLGSIMKNIHNELGTKFWLFSHCILCGSSFELILTCTKLVCLPEYQCKSLPLLQLRHESFVHRDVEDERLVRVCNTRLAPECIQLQPLSSNHRSVGENETRLAFELIDLHPAASLALTSSVSISAVWLRTSLHGRCQKSILFHRHSSIRVFAFLFLEDYQTPCPFVGAPISVICKL